jgi:hypothetical protein
VSYFNRLTSCVLAAGLLLLAVVSGANARRFQISNQLIRLDFISSLGTSAVEWEWSCHITLEGSFHSRTFSKVSGQLIGYITRTTRDSRSCLYRNATEARLLDATLPWHIRFDSFTETLPSIRFIRLQFIGVAWLVLSAGVSCLYRSTVSRPLTGFFERELTNSRIKRLRLEEAEQIPYESGPLCPSEQKLAGIAEVYVLNTTTSITVQLVQ